MSIALEFLGGPLDGQWQAFPQAIDRHTIFLGPPLTPTEPTDPDATVPACEASYQRRRLPFMTRDVFCWEGVRATPEADRP